MTLRSLALLFLGFLSLTFSANSYGFMDWLFSTPLYDAQALKGLTFAELSGPESCTKRTSLITYLMPEAEVEVSVKTDNSLTKVEIVFSP